MGQLLFIFVLHLGVKSAQNVAQYSQQNITYACTCRERSDSFVECLTQDRGAMGSSLIGVTASCSLARLSTGSTQEDPSLHY